MKIKALRDGQAVLVTVWTLMTIPLEEKLVKKNIEDQSPNNTNSAKLHWRKPMARCFVDVMLEQVHRGNKVGPRFNDRDWAWMIALFNQKFGLLCCKGVLEETYLSLMDAHNNITDFLSRVALCGTIFNKKCLLMMSFGKLISRRKKRKPATSPAYSRKVQRPIKEEILEAFDEKPYLIGIWTGNKVHRDFNSVNALQIIRGTDDDELGSHPTHGR